MPVSAAVSAGDQEAPSAGMASPSSRTGWSTGVSVAAGMGSGVVSASVGVGVGVGVGEESIGGSAVRSVGVGAWGVSTVGAGSAALRRVRRRRGLGLQGVAQLASGQTSRWQLAGSHATHGPAIVAAGAERDGHSVARGEIDLVVRVRLDLFPVDAGAEAGCGSLGDRRLLGRRRCLLQGRGVRSGGTDRDHGRRQKEDGEQGRG